MADVGLADGGVLLDGQYLGPFLLRDNCPTSPCRSVRSDRRWPVRSSTSACTPTHLPSSVERAELRSTYRTLVRHFDELVV